MEDPTVKGLADCFVQTLNPNPEVIKQAESALKTAAAQPGYAIAVLKVVALDAPVEIRQAAAVSFKNFVKFNWAPEEHVTTTLVDPEKDEIKRLITSLMLSTPPIVRAQLSEALAIISRHDFPAKWQGLLPELLERLKSGESQTVLGVLETANSIYKRYRNVFMTDEVSRELEYSQQLVAPLLQVLKSLSAKVQANGADAGQLRVLLSSVRLVCRIFFSLNSPGLTEEFENTLDDWMAEFHTYLTYANPALAESDPEKESIVDAVKSAVCQNINLFMEMNEEEFAKFLGTFVQAVWMQLINVTLQPSQDNLAMNAIRFLNTVAKSVHHALFKNEDALKQVCEKIVIPNLKIREDVEELFDMNFIEYIRRDTEGSDVGTRRRAAADLVKSLTEKFPAEVTQMFSGYVGAMLSEYATNPAQNWKSKDCAIYLVMALTVRGKTAALGATETNQLVSITDFFSQQILPELQSPAVNDTPILKADALKFLTTFRSQIPKATCVSVFSNLVSLLGSESNVVHSYAAICIERLLASKESGKLRFTVADLNPVLGALLEKLFGAFKMPESNENEYLMKCVMRVISFVGPQITPVAAVCLQQLAQMLLAVCKNPTQPGFNHYLFESVAALIRFTCEADPAKVTELETQLFPAFQIVLQEDVQEFHPYVFQIFSQLIELRPAPLAASYMQIFPPLLTPLFWERQGNVPALVRLLQAYLRKAAGEVVQGGHLQAVLGVFQKLIASKAHDHQGFLILTALVEHLKLEAFAQYLPQIWTLLFTRLQSAKTPKYVRSLLVFLALFVARRGGGTVQASIDGVQPGLFVMLLQQVWLPTMPSIQGTSDEKLMVVATTKVLCECSALQAPEAAAVWGQLLDTELKCLEQRTVPIVGPEDEEAEADDYGGYSAAYAQLHNAHVPTVDPVADVKDVKQHLALSLSNFSRSQPGRMPGLVATNVSPEMQQRLQGYFQSAGVSVA
ncbi:hypothetical protein WJX72_006417 [[Myrmecia] bisecta]|uniref:Importin N-terminal domain-containing protein n=1 Tax=[Myrmecia] bisecta TaxID=41462 RepID=A0AAW1R6Y8_9CHLO